MDNWLHINWPWCGIKDSGRGSGWKSELDIGNEVSVMTSSRRLGLTTLDQAVPGKGHVPRTYSPARLVQINDKLKDGEWFLCFGDHCSLKTSVDGIQPDSVVPASLWLTWDACETKAVLKPASGCGWDSHPSLLRPRLNGEGTTGYQGNTADQLMHLERSLRFI